MAKKQKVIEFVAQDSSPEQKASPASDAAMQALKDLMAKFSKEFKDVLKANDQYAKKVKDYIKAVEDSRKREEARSKSKSQSSSPPPGQGPPKPPPGQGPPNPPPPPPQNPENVPDPQPTFAEILRQWKSGGKEFNQLVKAVTQGRHAIAGLVASINPTLRKIGMAAAAWVGLTQAARKYHELVEKALASVGAFSADANFAKARGRIMQIEDRIRSAREIGGDVSGYIDAQNSFARAGRDIFRDLTAAFLPVLTMLLWVVTGILKVARLISITISFIMEGIEIIVETVLQIASFIPGVGPLFKAIYDWMRKDDQPQDTMDDRINKMFGMPDPDFVIEDIKRGVKGEENKNTRTMYGPRGFVIPPSRQNARQRE